jgi:hypothetical protein
MMWEEMLGSVQPGPVLAPARADDSLTEETGVVEFIEELATAAA